VLFCTYVLSETKKKSIVCIYMVMFAMKLKFGRRPNFEHCYVGYVGTRRNILERG